MSLFNFSIEEMLSFFAVLVRYSVLAAVMPFIGDRMVPVPVKVLFALSVSVALFPSLVARGDIHPGEAARWASSVAGIASTIALEALFGLALGFTAKLCFDAILFGGNLIGTFMGFAMASSYDPHQETQTEVVAEVQLAIAMLLFLALDGHHLMLRASLDSYRIVGLGKAGFAGMASQRLIDFTGEVIRFAVQIAAPVAVSLFAVNLIFGVMAKAMPQLNVLVLSLGVSALVGLVVVFLSIPAFQSAATGIFERMGDWMEGITVALKGA